MVEQLDGKCGRVKAQVGKAKKQACIYSYANNDDYMLGIADRLDILEVILPILISEYNMPSADELIHFKDYYINKVNMFRNRLGHVKLGEQVLHIQGSNRADGYIFNACFTDTGTNYSVPMSVILFMSASASACLSSSLVGFRYLCHRPSAAAPPQSLPSSPRSAPSAFLRTPRGCGHRHCGRVSCRRAIWESSGLQRDGR